MDNDKPSYLTLVERNNELLEKLLTALEGWEVPEIYRPMVNGWYQRVNLPAGSSPACGLSLNVTVEHNGLRLTLDTWDGNRLRQLVIPFNGTPLPQ